MHLPLGQTTDIIADAMQAGEADLIDIVDRVTAVLGKQGRWLPVLVKEVIQKFGHRWRPTERQTLAHFIANNEGFLSVWQSDARPVVIRLIKRAPRQSPPVKPLRAVTLPHLPTCGDLATWLSIPPTELEWFADRWRFSARHAATPLHHYNYKYLEKQDGRPRLIEIPKYRLRTLQRKVLDGILTQIPPHDAVHGFRKGRNIVSYASPHTGKSVVIRLDLTDFFISIPAGRIFGLLSALGYPKEVARILTALCTNRVPTDCLLDKCLRQTTRAKLGWQERQRYQCRHLPQGAPTSPALANLCAYRLDVRLSALARSLGATYTRYADDLAFSGGCRLDRMTKRFCVQAAAIALEEGFSVHPHKTRIMHHGTRQHLAGVVVNQHPNMAREEFDKLKAILTNCVRHGPASQNRDGHRDFRAHLAGRLAQALQLNPYRGEKLKTIFKQINWEKM